MSRFGESRFESIGSPFRVVASPEAEQRDHGEAFAFLRELRRAKTRLVLVSQGEGARRARLELVAGGFEQRELIALRARRRRDRRGLDARLGLRRARRLHGFHGFGRDRGRCRQRIDGNCGGGRRRHRFDGSSRGGNELRSSRAAIGAGVAADRDGNVIDVIPATPSARAATPTTGNKRERLHQPDRALSASSALPSRLSMARRRASSGQLLATGEEGAC